MKQSHKVLSFITLITVGTMILTGCGQNNDLIHTFFGADDATEGSLTMDLNNASATIQQDTGQEMSTIQLENIKTSADQVSNDLNSLKSMTIPSGYDDVSAYFTVEQADWTQIQNDLSNLYSDSVSNSGVLDLHDEDSLKNDLANLTNILVTRHSLESKYGYNSSSGSN